MRVILDTSIIVSGMITPQGTAAQVIQYWIEGEFTLLISAAIVEELEDVLNRTWVKERLSALPKRIPDFLAAVVGLAEMVTGYTNVQGYVRDPFDEMFLACARLGQADVIVSLDKDLLALERFETTKILRPSDFLRLLKL